MNNSYQVGLMTPVTRFLKAISNRFFGAHLVPKQKSLEIRDTEKGPWLGERVMLSTWRSSSSKIKHEMT